MCTAAAEAAVLDVGVGHAYATVADAIAAAANGDDIVLFDAAVTEDVTIDALRKLTIRPAPGVAVSWQPATDIAAHLRSDAEVRFERIQFAGPGVAAIWVEHGDLTVVRSSFTGFDLAVATDATDPSSVTLIRTDFVANDSVLDIGDTSTLEVVGSRFIANTGGVLMTYDTTVVDIAWSAFEANRSDGYLAFCGMCTITDSVFLDNESSGIMLLGTAALVLERNRFCDNLSFGTVWAGSPEPASLRNNAFVGNRGGTVLANNSLALTLEHNTFLANETLNIAQLDPAVTMVGNLVAGSTSPYVAFVAAAGAVVSQSYDAWWDNSGGHADFALGATDLVDVDPLLAGVGGRCSWDRIRPMAGSPLIDGDPTLLDADGSAADIGATGGPAAP